MATKLDCTVEVRASRKTKGEVITPYDLIEQGMIRNHAFIK